MQLSGGLSKEESRKMIRSVRIMRDENRQCRETAEASNNLETQISKVERCSSSTARSFLSMRQAVTRH